VKWTPTIFSAHSVQRILTDRRSQLKTMTRRLITWPLLGPRIDGKRRVYTAKDLILERAAIVALCPKGGPGDRIWGREACIIAPPRFTSLSELKRMGCPVDDDGNRRLIQYLADNPDTEAALGYGLRVTPPMFMPRWVSRFSLEITEVRVERVQDISEDDARAEGCDPCPYVRGGPGVMPGGCPCHIEGRPYACSYAQGWNGLNGHRKGASWEEGPHCFAITFKRIRNEPLAATHP
jgi:hypothetical protein